MNKTALRSSSGRIPRWLVILLIALAGLMLEVGYTRIVSFKLWYYYTYLVIGLSLLGIGSGGILAAIWHPLRRATTERIVAVCAVWGAVSIAVGYYLVARLPVETLAIWRYELGDSTRNLALLSLICLALFATFIAFGIIVAVLLGRAGDQIGRLYFSDLVGAGLGCLLAIPLIIWMGPPRLIMLAALVFALVGVVSLRGWDDSPEGQPDRPELSEQDDRQEDLDGDRPRSSRTRTVTAWVGAGSVVVLAVLALFGDTLPGRLELPDVRVDDDKISPDSSASPAEHSEWGPVFRVDVVEEREQDEHQLLLHNATFGSSIWAFDGDEAGLTRFDGDARSLPFHVFGEDTPPANNLIVGSAGGHEILTSLYYGVDDISGVELNPVTVDILEDTYSDYTGNLPDRPEVDIIEGDGRTYLARSDDSYDLVWFVAPDSYAASNPASSGGFVLSESYLYTTEMLEETLDHLTEDGLLVAQFGEMNYRFSPNRTARYLVTARHALEELGVEDPSQHIMVSAEIVDGIGDFSTIMVKRTPFTPEEVERFAAGVADVDRNNIQASEHVVVYAPGGVQLDDAEIDRLAAGQAKPLASLAMVLGLAGGDAAQVSDLVSGYDQDISVVTDDQPFFWHFSKFGDVVRDIFEPHDVFVADPEEIIGERVMVLLLLISALYAAVFLFLPFATVRERWKRLPLKANSGLYFACLGLGFMFYEITLIQRLVLFLGYPTLSLTVTLAAILIFTGIGALLSDRFVNRSSQTLPVLLGVLAVLTVFYQFGIDGMTDAFLSQGTGVRVALSLAVLAPLGLCLGMFMPLGLGVVGSLSGHQQEYVAWSWAVNGFFSVIGSVLTTMLSMMIGFNAVLTLAFLTYVVAVASFVLLKRRSEKLVPVEKAPEAAGPAKVLAPT